jgi:hypothetical protein
MKMTQRKCNLFVHWSEAAKTAFHRDIGLRLHSGCFLGYSSHELFLKSLSKEKSMKLNFEYDFSLRKAKSVFVHDGGGGHTLNNTATFTGQRTILGSLLYVGLRARTQIIRMSDKCSYLLNHIVEPTL